LASLPSILILGADTVAAAAPATPVQLVHACRRWGFSTVIPASWGDELIATEVIQRCAARSARPVVQCSCPWVADKLGQHAAILDDAIFWIAPPPVAVAKYIRSIEATRDVHLTYAGGCPGAIDSSIDECISPHELLAALSSRGIDVAAQPTIFDDTIPADRRRFASSPGGTPDQQQLWETASFRLTQPNADDLTVSIAQLLLTEDRLLIDLSPALGCVCRVGVDTNLEASLLRSPTPIVPSGTIDLSRPAPIPVAPPPARPVTPPPEKHSTQPQPAVPPPQQPRPSPVRPIYRRQSTWRRQSPRPGMVVARTSSVMLAVPEPIPLLRRPEARWIITAIIATAALVIGLWAGRRTATTTTRAVGALDVSRRGSPAQLWRFRSL
jgi:hypothetical protein